MTENVTSLAKDFSLEEIAEALGMSTRWVRDRCKYDDAEHIRYGHKIKMTAEQVDKLRATHTKTPDVKPVESVTTGRKKKAS